MQCAAILTTGKQCSRSAEAGSPSCYQHRDPNAPHPAPSSFYARDLPRRDQQLLEEAALMVGADNEIAALRLVIEKKLSEPDYDAARLAIDALGRLLRNNHAIRGTTDEISSWLDRLIKRANDKRLTEFGRSLAPDPPAGPTLSPRGGELERGASPAPEPSQTSDFSDPDRERTVQEREL